MNSEMDDNRVIEGSGNVYADFGYPDAEERLAKARLAMKINQIIADRKLSQRAAAALLGADQPKISLIARGHLRGFSVERLMTYLNRLGQDVEINVYPTPAGRSGSHTTVHTYEEGLAAAQVKREGMPFS